MPWLLVTAVMLSLLRFRWCFWWGDLTYSDSYHTNGALRFPEPPTTTYLETYQPRWDAWGENAGASGLTGKAMNVPSASRPPP